MYFRLRATQAKKNTDKKNWCFHSNVRGNARTAHVNLCKRAILCVCASSKCILSIFDYKYPTPTCFYTLPVRAIELCMNQ